MGKQLVRMRSRYQITVPARMSKKAGISVGDVLSAEVHGGSLTFRPQRLVDREIDRALEDVAEGNVASFSSAEDLIDDLHRHRAPTSRGGKKHRAP